MTDDKSQLYNLSRRKMLAGLGAIGLASAGAGLGTSAYFSDTEAFTNNSLTAGTLDMTVTADVVAANDYWVDNGALDISAVADSEEAVMGLVVDDIKPGDWAIICFDIDIDSNPGYVQVTTENFAEDGGANPEPEQEAEGDTNNSDDLGQYLLTTVWQGYDDTSGDKSGLSTLDPVFNNVSGGSLAAYQEPFNLDGEVDTDNSGGIDGADTAHYTNAREADDILSGGYIIKDPSQDPLPIGGVDGSSYEFCLLLELPYEVGNVVQGDSVSFDLVFDTEQVRNNDDPFNNTVA
ncbi:MULTISPECIES: SipW-dependent-type signal peptide-containing protein [Salinibaculum]|uniref:SipW-dependent-type signal peptide-containing protein n=1 Tax=Salinibaculum TaxID=2732368 RepID=UPI0030D1FD8B